MTLYFEWILSNLITPGNFLSYKKTHQLVIKSNGFYQISMQHYVSDIFTPVKCLNLSECIPCAKQKIRYILVNKPGPFLHRFQFIQHLILHSRRGLRHNEVSNAIITSACKFSSSHFSLHQMYSSYSFCQCTDWLSKQPSLSSADDQIYWHR